MARVGILGGTFDPPHIGHIAIAEAALIMLDLTKIIFVPAHIPPHKVKTTSASAADRMSMLRLAIGDTAAFEISDIELLREGPSFTVDTLEELKRQRPGDELYLIIGFDNVAEIETWHRPERIFELAKVAAANRPGYMPKGRFASATILFHMIPCDVSSTAIRQELRKGNPIDGLVAPAVQEYIKKHRLYKHDG